MRHKKSYLNLDELCVLFNYSSVESVRGAIKRGAFPVPTYIRSGRRVATRQAVRRHFERIRDHGANDKDVRRARRQSGWKRFIQRIRPTQ